MRVGPIISVSGTARRLGRMAAQSVNSFARFARSIRSCRSRFIDPEWLVEIEADVVVDAGVDAIYSCDCPFDADIAPSLKPISGRRFWGKRTPNSVRSFVWEPQSFSLTPTRLRRLR